jgi:hypothetical protein
MPGGALFYAFIALLAVVFLWRAIRRARNIQRAFGPEGLVNYRLLKQAGGRAAGLAALGVTEEELDFIAKHGEFPPTSKSELGEAPVRAGADEQPVAGRNIIAEALENFRSSENQDHQKRG